MKYIKKFEMNDNEPKLGDYVICNHDDSNLIYSNEETEFISNKIGRIINIDKEEFFKYFISYDCYIPFSIYDGLYVI